MSNPSVFDKLTSLFQNLVSSGSVPNQQTQRAASMTSPSISPDPLVYQTDQLRVTGVAMQGLQTKKIWEKPIGAKFNMNDEVNHIAQQAQLNAIGFSELRAMFARQNNGQRPSW